MHRRVHANLNTLKAIAPKIGLEQKSVTDTETRYVAMTNTFSAVLKGLKTRNAENLENARS